MAWWNPWSWSKPKASWSIGDPAMAEYFGVGQPNFSGVPVGEGTALGLSAFYRAGALIAGTIAGLPLRTLRDVEGTRTRVNSVMDNPGGDDGQTPFGWKETVLWHQFLHGDAFLAHVYNGAGSLVALTPIHPLAVTVTWAKTREGEEPVPGGKIFTATLDTGERREFDARTMTQIMGPSLDGLRGMSVIRIARNSLGTAIAGDRAAAKMFSSGALQAGMVTPEEDVTEAEAKVIKDSLNAKTAGWENANEIAVINRKLKFTPWTMSMEDAQFLQSRQFQIEEIARWTGVPPHLLMQTEKQTSWGTGVAEQNRGLGRFTLSSWTSRMEQTLSRVLTPPDKFCEFDYAGLERPTPEQEIDLLIKQVQAGLMTPNEARRIRNMDPIPGGDVLQAAAGAPVPALEPAGAPA